MKTTNYTFLQSKIIFQVYRNCVVYTKAEKNNAAIKNQLPWKPMRLDNSFVKAEKLYLPEVIIQQPDFENADIILLINTNTCSSLLAHHTTDNSKFYKKNAIIELDIFSLKIKDTYELHLLYNQFTVGLPERADFKLCELKEIPTEIKINGKLDFSLTSRRERTYIEQQYIWQCLGTFNDAELYKMNTEFTTAEIPQNRKIIDLRKPLW